MSRSVLPPTRCTALLNGACSSRRKQQQQQQQPKGHTHEYLWVASAAAEALVRHVVARLLRH